MRDLLLAPTTPSVSLDGKAEWMLIMDRSSYPTIAELAEPELRIGGLRMNPANFSTIKFRPVAPEDVSDKWRKFNGFKIEADASEKGIVKSASFTMPVEKGLIKAVVKGEKSIAKLFTKEQEDFLAEMANYPIDFSALAILGPLKANRWKFEDQACPWKITAELWRREDGERLMEASIKAPIAQAAAAIGGFMAFLAEVGAERDSKQQTKTHWALDFYAAKLRGTKGVTQAKAPKK
jgi:hypothetical protein